MACIKFYRGAREKYDAELYEDGIYFATDTREIIVNDVTYCTNTIQEVGDGLSLDEEGTLSVVVDPDSAVDKEGNPYLTVSDKGLKLSEINVTGSTTIVNPKDDGHVIVTVETDDDNNQTVTITEEDIASASTIEDLLALKSLNKLLFEINAELMWWGNPQIDIWNLLDAMDDLFTNGTDVDTIIAELDSLLTDLEDSVDWVEYDGEGSGDSTRDPSDVGPDSGGSSSGSDEGEPAYGHLINPYSSSANNAAITELEERASDLKESITWEEYSDDNTGTTEPGPEEPDDPQS